MREKIELTGIVLSSTMIGDYDKRLVILTKERGKITAFARGARKPNSPLMGISEPFNFGKFTLLEGFDAYRLLSADIKEYFLEVKNDIEGICYATYFCDILEFMCVEGVGDIQILNLLYVTLKALAKKEVLNGLIRRIFELKLLDLDGEAMVAFGCAKCGSKDLVAFFLAANGLLCKDCLKKAGEVTMLHSSTIYTIQYVLSAPLNKLYSFTLTEEIGRQFDLVVGRYFVYHVPKNFKSLEILTFLS